MNRPFPRPPVSDRKRILIICDYFLPGTKGGGGAWTIVNLVESLKNSFEFFVITRDHDGKSDSKPYTNVKYDVWNEIGNGKVFYLPSREITVRRLAELSESVAPDAVYLNSVFSELVVRFLVAKRLGKVSNLPVIDAPIGNLAPGAINLKGRKKRVYLMAARVLGLYRDVVWKASSPFESKEIQDVFGRDIRVRIAPDLPPRQILPNYDLALKPMKRAGSARLIYYSRIDPKKNLMFLLERLRQVTTRRIDLTIAGPVDDTKYWLKCKNMIGDLPKNINVTEVGVVSYDAGLELLLENHFFVLPTFGENFGYVMLEALAAGCPLLISDQTIWGSVGEKKAGWAVPLESDGEWLARLSECAEMNAAEYSDLSHQARKMAVEWMSDNSVRSATLEVFQSVLS